MSADDNFSLKNYPACKEIVENKRYPLLFKTELVSQ